MACVYKDNEAGTGRARPVEELMGLRHLTLGLALVLGACGGRTSGLTQDQGPMEKKGDASPLVSQAD